MNTVTAAQADLTIRRYAPNLKRELAASGRSGMGESIDSHLPGSVQPRPIPQAVHNHGDQRSAPQVIAATDPAIPTLWPVPIADLEMAVEALEVRDDDDPETAAAIGRLRWLVIEARAAQVAARTDHPRLCLYGPEGWPIR